MKVCASSFLSPFRWVAALAVFACSLLPGWAWASASGVVISQVYGGGGNSGASLRNDFIELFNAGATTVQLTGWSVQYASAAGSTWQVTNLGNVALLPGQYFLVQEAVGAGGTVNLPTPDASGSIAMSGTAGKVALVSSTTALTGAAPTGPTLVDLVGFGAAGFYEGSGPTPAPSNTTAVFRAGGGCTDSNDNAADFAAGAPNPRNSAVAPAPCGGAQPSAPIVAVCPAMAVAAGSGGNGIASASDADGIVDGVSASTALPPGIQLGAFTPAAAVGGSASVVVQVLASQPVGSVAVGLTWRNGQGQTAACTVQLDVSAPTPIYSIQGSGATSPLAGRTVVTSGVVTKVTNNGFFIQDPVGDGDPATSDGIFVFTSTAPAVSAGQRVQLGATVAEFNTGSSTDSAAHTVTELTGPNGITVLGSGSVTPVVLTLPLARRDDMERYEGMLVTINGPLTVSQNFYQGRYGQVTLSALGRLETPTNRLRPGAAALALDADNWRRSIVLDDATTAQYPNPTPYIGADATLRAGDELPWVTGVVDFGLAAAGSGDRASYKLQPVQLPAFYRGNARTAVPAPVGGNVRLASFNVLNFFTTFTNGSTAAGASGQGCTQGSTTSAGNCRGADNAAEFVRQRSKIVEALAAINADAVGLMEIQNNGSVAAQNLVDALNARLGAKTYAVVPDPVQGTGTDAIKVAMIYQPRRLDRAGGAVSDPDPVHNRPPLAQTFSVQGGQSFTFVVNHFKSKGCDGATGLDADRGDLQGCFNATRVLQAQALRRFVDRLAPNRRSAQVVMVGDFNAYAQEDPIADLAGAGYVDLVARYPSAASAFGYSYVFDSAAGRLDHAIASVALGERVTGVAHWHINADEPEIIDYNTESKQPACAACALDLYTPTPYRASDHDPVVIGIQIGTGPATASRSPQANGAARN